MYSSLEMMGLPGFKGGRFKKVKREIRSELMRLRKEN